MQIRIKKVQKGQRMCRSTGTEPSSSALMAPAVMQVIDRGVSREHARDSARREMVFLHDLDSATAVRHGERV